MIQTHYFKSGRFWLPVLLLITLWPFQTYCQTVLFDTEAKAETREAYRFIQQANLLADSGKIDQALEKYQAAIKLIPQNPRPYYYIGFLRAGQGEYHEAELVFQQALKLWPAYPEANASLGAIYLQYGAYEKAYPLLRKALSENPRLADANNNMGGYFFMHLHNLDSAAYYFEQSIRHDSSFSDAYINLANIYLQQSKLEQADALSRKALELSPNTASVYFLSGNIAFQSDQYQTSIELYKKALGLNPELHEIYYNMGRAYVILSELNQAKIQLDNLKPYNAKLYTLLKELIEDNTP